MAQVSALPMEAHFVESVKRIADDLRERAIRDAVASFEENLRKAVLERSVNLAEFYDIKASGGDMTLTVKVK